MLSVLAIYYKGGKSATYSKVSILVLGTNPLHQDKKEVRGEKRVEKMLRDTQTARENFKIKINVRI
jgi:hypothetical protein